MKKKTRKLTAGLVSLELLSSLICLLLLASLNSQELLVAPVQRVELHSAAEAGWRLFLHLARSGSTTSGLASVSWLSSGQRMGGGQIGSKEAFEDIWGSFTERERWLFSKG